MDFISCLFYNILIAILGFALSLWLVPKYCNAFGVAQLQGLDLNTHGYRLLPEGLGVVTIAVYIVCMILFIPFIYMNDWAALILNFLALDIYEPPSSRLFDFDHREFSHYMGVLLTISFMALVGFADDVLQLKRQHKIILPAIATLPLLMIYYTGVGNTTVDVPEFLQNYYGTHFRLGPLYYLYLILFVVYCTNSISLISGINGIEVGQAVVICLSIICLNFWKMTFPGPCASHHRFSVFFMIPFAAVSMGLLRYDWYPARLFVGDTYCYVAGITFAAVAILGHFTVILFMFLLPQLFNFVYSIPQLLRILPCQERRRLPAFRQDSGLIDMSMVILKVDYKKIPWILKLMYRCKLVHVEIVKVENATFLKFNNLTLNNYILKIFGPMQETKLASTLLLIQCICSAISFLLLYLTSNYSVTFPGCALPATPKP